MHGVHAAISQTVSPPSPFFHGPTFQPSNTEKATRTGSKTSVKSPTWKALEFREGINHAVVIARVPRTSSVGPKKYLSVPIVNIFQTISLVALKYCYNYACPLSAFQCLHSFLCFPGNAAATHTIWSTDQCRKPLYLELSLQCRWSQMFAAFSKTFTRNILAARNVNTRVLNFRYITHFCSGFSNLDGLWTSHLGPLRARWHAVLNWMQVYLVLISFCGGTIDLKIISKAVTYGGFLLQIMNRVRMHWPAMETSLYYLQFCVNWIRISINTCCKECTLCNECA